MNDDTPRGYFQPQQAREVAEAFAKHSIDYMFIGKSGAILLGYPAATQDVDLFPKRDPENGRRLVAALREIQFDISNQVAEQIIKGVDLVQLKQGLFDLDLIFASDGIESFEAAKKRMIIVDGFPTANLQDIIASKRAAGRQRDLNDLPLLEDFQQEFEKRFAKPLRTALEIAMEREKDLTSK